VRGKQRYTLPVTLMDFNIALIYFHCSALGQDPHALDVLHAVTYASTQPLQLRVGVRVLRGITHQENFTQVVRPLILLDPVMADLKWIQFDLMVFWVRESVRESDLRGGR
jgi:hypothetical protein